MDNSAYLYFVYITAKLPTADRLKVLESEETPKVDFFVREPDTFGVTERYEV